MDCMNINQSAHGVRFRCPRRNRRGSSRAQHPPAHPKGSIGPEISQTISRKKPRPLEPGFQNLSFGLFP